MSDLALRRPSGPNDWLVDEIYERYRVDPSSVSEMWRDFFDGYQPPVIPTSSPGHDQKTKVEKRGPQSRR